MSRIGNNPIQIPSGVNINLKGPVVEVIGPKGTLEMRLMPQIKIEMEDGILKLTAKDQQKITRSLHGLTRTLINNMVVGVTQGWSKELEMVGVGYRAQGGGDSLTLSVGFSHPVIIKAPEGITFNVADNTKITVSGIDKNLVGQVTANIRGIKPPEVYKGKGIRLVGEYVRKKAGKAGKAVVGVK